MTPVKFIVNFNHFRDQKNSKSSSTKILGRQLREHTVDSLKGHAAKECFVESCQLLHIVWNVLWNFISLTLSPFWQTLLDAHTVQLQLQLPNYVTGLVNLSISLKFTLASKKKRDIENLESFIFTTYDVPTVKYIFGLEFSKLLRSVT